MNPFEQLMAWLDDGTLSRKMLMIAYRASLRRDPNIPEPIKDILCGKSEGGGLLSSLFVCIGQITGSTELAYYRGHYVGMNDKEKQE